MKCVRRTLLTCSAVLLVTACAPRELSTSARPLALMIGADRVRAVLTLPVTAEPVPAVVLLAGYGSSDMDETVGRTKPFRDLAAGLGRRGIATLRFDKPTRYAPPPVDFTPTQEYAAATNAAVALLRNQPGVNPARIFVLGHSFGGSMAPRAVEGLNVAGLILVSAPARPISEILSSQFRYLRSLGGAIGHNATLATEDAEAFRAAVTSPALSPGTVLRSELAYGYRGSYFLDLRGYDPVRAAAELRVPMLFLQGRRDYLVTVEQDLEVWVKALRDHPQVTVRVYPEANHAMVNGIGRPSPEEYEHPGHVAGRVISDIATWIRQH